MADVVRVSLGFWIRRRVSGGEVHLERRWLGLSAGRGGEASQARR
jgi:hypothetical protein